MPSATRMQDLLEPPVGRHEETQVSASVMPVVHAGTVALYQPAQPVADVGNTAVLLVSPWGFEEICTRKLWRTMAEEFAARGIPSLRFDYPGTGDALDIPPGDWHQGYWRSSVVQFAQLLKELSGCGNILLVGQGLGAALAYEASLEIPDVAGLALLAPVLDGRAYLRELSVWSRMTEPLTASIMPDHLVLGGEIISKPVAEDIRAIKLKAENALKCPIFLALREDHAAGADFEAQLRSGGSAVEICPYSEYAALVSNLTLQALPANLLRSLADWAENAARLASQAKVNSSPGTAGAILESDTFVETHLHLGDGTLHGILCEPRRKAAAAASVILLNPSYEKAAGWGRSVAMLARDLAVAGVASLRFDMANVGDSPPRQGAPAQVLYTESQEADVRAAIELMQRHGHGPLIVAGRCSGAYLSFRSVLKDKRLSGAVIANAYTLEWNQQQSLDDLLLFVPQRLGSYTTKAFTIHSWKKILSGEVNIRRGVTNISNQVLQKAMAALKTRMKRLGFIDDRGGRIQQAVRSITERGAELSFIYSEGDIGLDYFRRHFHLEEDSLAGFPDVGFSLLKNAEHNLLTPQARETLKTEIEQMAKRVAASQADSKAVEDQTFAA